MPTPRPSSPLPSALRRSRRRLLFLTGGAFLLFAGVTALIDPPGPFPQAYQTPKFWSAGVCLLALLGAALAPREVYRLTWATLGGLLPLLWLEAGRLAAAGTLPYELTLWTVCAAGVAPLLLGARRGAAAVLAWLGGLALVLVRVPPTSPALLAAWVGGGLVTALAGGVGFVVTRLIETNLDLHEQASAQLHAARFDGLTGVLGRAATGEELRGRLEYAAGARTPLSVVMCDIDHFKAVNDSAGHAAGDDVLRGVARRLRRTVRGSGGVVGRWGGEEFLIVLPGLARPEAQALAERLRQAVGTLPVAGLPITASFGVASCRLQDDTPDAMLARADQALYDAKRSGRDCVR